MIYEIKNEKLAVKISSLGAELISAIGADGYEYIWSAEPGCWDSHAPILFPVCGRLLNSEYSYKGVTYPMSAHGFAGKSEFKATRVEKTRVTLVLNADAETKKIYPFDFSFVADFELCEDRLLLNLTVKNNGDETLPYMVGWHPGFNLEGDEPIGDFRLILGGAKEVSWYPLQNGCFVRPYGEPYALTDGAYPLTEEEIYKNDTMIFVGTGERALLTSPSSKHKVELKWSENLPYFCIWKDDFSSARFICLEPWSDVPAGGDAPEVFDDRRMSRLAGGADATYSYEARLF